MYEPSLHPEPDHDAPDNQWIVDRMHRKAEAARRLSGAEAQPGRENHEGDRACDAGDPGSSSPLSLTEWPL